MALNLVGSKVLITGATSGIGRETAKLLAQSGCVVAITGRRQERLEELELELQQAQDYADRLVAHKDMLCLPADLEGLRSANSHFAMENHILREQLRNK